MNRHIEGDTRSNDGIVTNDTMSDNDDCCSWKPNERDCESPFVTKPFVSIGLLGYGVYEAIDDRPIEDDIYEWYQNLGTIWHNRLVMLSSKSGKNPRSGCTSDGKPCDVLTIPSARLYRGKTKGCYIPERVLSEKKDNVCIVMIAFGKDDEEEEYMQVIHRPRIELSKFKRYSELKKTLCDDDGEKAMVRYSWSMESDTELCGYFDQHITEWRYIYSREERLQKQMEYYEQTYDKHGRYKNRPRLSLIQALYSCRVPYLYYENGIIPMFTPHKEDAMHMARSMGLGLFAYDFYTGFAKKFVVCTAQSAYEMIYKRKTYCIPPPDDDLHNVGYKSMYEGLIHSYPHKLILDLEYEREQNPDIEPDILTLKMIKYVGQLLNYVNEEDNWTPDIGDWIILQADSDKKISRHAILNAPGKFFRSMDDACRFRDVVKAVVEAGLMEDDKTVLNLMVNTTVKADEKTKKLLSKASSPAQQCFFDDHWKTCFNDWCVINNTFRLMRTCGSTKYGQNRFLRHASDISHFDTKDHSENTMVQLYKEAYGMLPDDPVSEDWITFMASLVQNPVPKDAPGWIVPQSRVDEIVDSLKMVVKEVVSDFYEKWNTLMEGDTSREEYGVVYCENKAQLARERGVKRKRRNSEVVHQMSSSFGRIEKYQLSPDDEQYSNVLRILKSVKDLEPVMRGTESWRIQACYTDKSKRGMPSWYSAMPNSLYCPIGGVHSKQGKTLINISKAGKVSATCLGARCVGTKWTATQKLSSTALHLLWK